MKATPPCLSATIPIKKEDLFWVLFRLYQLMNDADPFDDSLDDSDNEDSIVLQMETPDEGEEGVDIGDASPPNYFRTLYAAQYDFNVGMINEFIGLFAILSTPLDNDPVLKKEFIEYARQQGHDIEFSKGGTPPKTPKLFIVPPKTDNPDGTDEKPPKK